MTHREVKKAGCRRACKINAPRRTGRYMSKTVPEAHPDTGDSDCLQGGRKLSRNKLLPLKKKKIVYQIHIFSTQKQNDDTFYETREIVRVTGPLVPLRR